jgi:hypothetical protein
MNLAGQSNYTYKAVPELSARAFNEVAPVRFKNKLVYTSDQTISSSRDYTDNNNEPFVSIWSLEEKDDGKWGTPVLLSPELTTMQHDGPACFNTEGTLIVFTRNLETVNFGTKRNLNRNYGLFFADIEGETFSNIRPFEYNTPDSKAGHPSLDASGTILYFSSNREGGFGGFDLYYSILENGRWSKPQNLGPVVNTAENEIYPFIHPTGRLYFSSNGHDQVGGYDIFYSELYNNRWFSPVKLSSPFNSGLNDFTYWVNESFDNGFFSSNRRGSIDIFSFASNIPTFEICKKQQRDNYCYVFYEENTMELDSNLYQYQWDLGDNTKIRALEAEHCFAGPGDYLVQLNVIDKLTGIVEFSQAEYLVEVRKIVQPYITAPDSVRINQEIQMHGIESYLGGLTPGEYYWDFGDGSKAVGATVKHTYLTPGVFQLKLGILEELTDGAAQERFCAYRTIVVEE